MGECNSDDHYIYYHGQETLRRNGVALIVNKRVWNTVLGCNLTNDRMISVCFQGKLFNITVIQAYAQPVMLKSWSWMVLWRPTRPFITNTKKRCSFHYRELECKSRKSRNTWSNRQIWPWSIKWSRSKANRVLPREHTGHSKHPLLTTQEKILHMDITNGQYRNRIIFFAAKDGEALHSQQKQTSSWLWLSSWTPYCQIQT